MEINYLSILFFQSITISIIPFKRLQKDAAIQDVTDALRRFPDLKPRVEKYGKAIIKVSFI